MSNKVLVRSDERGIFVRAGGYVGRPGPVSGYAHIHKMDDGGLKASEHVKAHHLRGSGLIKIVLDDGTELHWSTQK